MREATVCIAEQRGLAIVMDGRNIVGVITGGDLARLLERDANALHVAAAAVMSREPQTARDDELGSAVVHRMETRGIMAMPVVDGQEALVGVVHLHDLMRAGAV
jgi:arabinose-5-phosphate isomerase